MKRESYLVKTRSVCAGKVFEFTLFVGVEYIIHQWCRKSRNFAIITHEIQNDITDETF